jgi:hypothetical protein
LLDTSLRGIKFNKSELEELNMIERIIIAAAIALFFTPATAIFSAEHPEHPKKGGAEHATKGDTEKQVSTADISAGIRKNIDADTKKSSDGKFHVKYDSQDLALDLTKVHDDRLQDLGGGKYFACLPDRPGGKNESH